MKKVRFGNLLRDRRQDAGIEIAELAKTIGMSPGVLGKFERGEREHPLDPEEVNALAIALKNVSVLEMVMAMGYQVSIAGLSPEELALVDQYRRLSLPGQAALEAGAKALEAMQVAAGEHPSQA